uniref:RING-type E3 ubiquitin transferase n=1 Tax=Ananas comosus var. bracteatus TaxID=296719 RepID=A0A6V7NXA9_ANACO|nr:unnamed protein product [Ananas comosus var. bracteatus]
MEVDLPEEFRCPISLEVMRDPVILTWSGQTYDRPSIQRWLDSGSRTCPLTNTPAAPAPLPSSYPPSYLLLTRSSSSSNSSSPTTPSDASSPPSSSCFSRARPRLLPLLPLRRRLPLPTPPPRQARRRRRSPPRRRLRRRLRPPPSRRRRRRGRGGGGEKLRDLALRALLHLSLDGDDARVGLVAEGAVDALAAALASPSAALAATTLTSLAVVEVNKCTIGAHPAAIPRLAALLLRRGAGAPRERREAATALYELCKFPENRRRAVRAGAVPPLVAFAAAGSERAVEVLGLIAKCQEGSPRGVENALLVLNLVCSYSEEMAAEAIEEGALDLCLPHLAEARNGKIAKNASGLAQTLQKMQLSGFV